MNKKILAYVFLVTGLTASAISPETNLPRPGDKLSRVLANPRSIQEYNDTLDLHQLDPISILVHQYLTMEEDGNETLYLTDGIETRRYAATDTTLWLSSRGWPGQAECLPIDSMSCEFMANDSVRMIAFTRDVLHGTDLFTKITGAQSVTVPRPITIIDPEGVTLNAAWKQIYRSEGLLLGLGDSIPIAEEITRYYADGFRYPIMEILDTEMGDGQSVTRKALYYPPEFQEEEIVEDTTNESIRNALAESLDDSRSLDGNRESDTARKDLSGKASRKNTSSSWSDGTNHISLYPPMVNQFFTVAYDYSTAASTAITLLSTSGQINLCRQASGDPKAGNEQIDCSNLSSGIYLVTVSHADITNTFKIVKL